MSGNVTHATLGGGCFWCLEAVFERIEGVKAVESGYAAGSTPNPNYEEICGGRSGHAEVVRIEFDPSVVSFETLLEIFWECHDPTTMNRQGADVGTQYRSIILYENEDQKRLAEKSKEAAASRFKNPIVTQLAPLTKFFPAEPYHQDYYRQNPYAPYCMMVISPKLRKLSKKKANS